MAGQLLISTFPEVDDVPTRVEFVLEGHIEITGSLDTDLGRDDMDAEKLLANTERALDRSQMSRNLIDLAMMTNAWGPIPATALNKAEAADGESVHDAFARGLALLRGACYLGECVRALNMMPNLGDTFVSIRRGTRQNCGAPTRSIITRSRTLNGCDV